MSTRVGVRLHNSELGDLAHSFGTALKVSDDVEPEPGSSTTGTGTDSEDGSTAMTSPESRAAEEGRSKVPEICLASNSDSEQDEEEGEAAGGDGPYERELELLLFFRPDVDDNDNDNENENQVTEYQYWSLDVLESRIQLTEECHKALLLDELTRHNTKKEAVAGVAESTQRESRWLSGIMDQLHNALDDWKAETGLSLTNPPHDERDSRGRGEFQKLGLPRLLHRGPSPPGPVLPEECLHPVPSASRECQL